MTMQRNVLIVDDDQSARDEVDGFLTRKGFCCFTANDGHQALDVLDGNRQISLVITDISMPGLSGLDFIQKARKLADHDLKFIVMTGHGGKNHAIRALKLSVSDFIEKPLKLEDLRRASEAAFEEIRTKAGEQRHVENLRLELVEEREKVDELGRQVMAAYVESLDCLKIAADYRDPETANHIRRIGAYSRVIAEDLGWDESRLDLIERAAPFHDIGKIGTPDNILLKPGKLTPDEVEIMKQHVQHGHRILLQSNHAITECAATIAWTHHEKWDGSGYPLGLKGEEIPLVGRIVAVADVYDALRSERPYKTAFSHEKAMTIMLDGDGRTAPEHFDPQLLDIFTNRADTFAEIFDRLAD